MAEHQTLTPIPYQILSNVQTKAINWLWHPYIPRGAITGIVGDGGYGKSWMVCSLVADLSKGRPLPGQQPLPPMRSLIISAEDGIGEIIKPKMEVLNADMTMIAAYDEGFAINPRMIERIKLAIQEFDVAVVFLDPLVSYFGGSADMYKANETRAIMVHLDALAKAFNIAVVFVHHVKKGFASVTQHKALGSVDFVNGSRSLLHVDISATGQYYMQHAKSNWAKKGLPLAYDFNGDRFEWLGEYYIPTGPDGIELSRTRRGKVQSFLIHNLRPGPMPAVELMKLAHDEGINERSLMRAKKGIAHSVQRKLPDGRPQWFWELCPEAVPHPDAIGTSPIKLLDSMGSQVPEVKISNPEPQETDMERIIREARERMQ